MWSREAPKSRCEQAFESANKQAIENGMAANERLFRAGAYEAALRRIAGGCEDPAAEAQRELDAQRGIFGELLTEPRIIRQ